MNNESDAAPTLDVTSVASTLAAAWEQVLEVDDVDVDTDVFELGAHSLHIGRVAGTLARTMDIEIPFAMFFEYPTSRELAEAIIARPERR